jgi:hypothetical protein
MIHDKTASTLSLARNILGGIDRSHLETSIQTASLVLLLETLIDLGTPSINVKMADAQERTVMGAMAAVAAASEGR